MNISTTPNFKFVNKRSENGFTLFTLENRSNSPYPISLTSASLTNNSSHVSVPKGTDIRVDGDVNTVGETAKVELTCRVAFGGSSNIAYKFNLDLPLY